MNSPVSFAISFTCFLMFEVICGGVVSRLFWVVFAPLSHNFSFFFELFRRGCLTVFSFGNALCFAGFIWISRFPGIRRLLLRFFGALRGTVRLPFVNLLEGFLARFEFADVHRYPYTG